MSPIRILFPALLLAAFQLTGQIDYLGLGHTMTTDLTLCSDTIYASTYNGLYKKHIASADTTWIPCGLQGHHVVQTLVRDYKSFISVVEIGNTRRTRIHSSRDGGSTFELLLADTSMVNSYQYLDHLAHPGNSFDTLFSLNHRKKTFDRGKTWIPMKDYSIRFIKVHPVHNNEVFMGGETMIFSAELKRSTDYGEQFKSIGMTGYFQGDNSIHDMEFSGERWICVGEGIIAYTDTYGQKWIQTVNTWSAASPWAMYITDIERGENGYMYASGESGTADKIGLFFSSTEGEKWDTISFASHKRTNPRIKCIAVYSYGFSDYIFMGGNGVYRYKKIFASVPFPELGEERLEIYPNPSLDGHFFFQSGFDSRETISAISLFDLIGRAHRVQFDGSWQFYVSGKGIFVVRIYTSQRVIHQRIVRR